MSKMLTRLSDLGRPIISLFVLAALAPVAAAFPPAPYYTIYGMVRDENGNSLRVNGSRVVFYKDGVEFLSETIKDGEILDQNYQIRLRMDMLRNGTQSYNALANSTGTPFTLGIVLHDVVYYPIEISSTLQVGKPGERLRLDLTLGVDSDEDGIPDAWEESQLHAAGIRPGENGWDLSLITRDGDFDGDGISNWDEYIAGTYATDSSDYFKVEISAKFPESARLSFYSIYGKTYSLETSTDLKTWAPASVYLSNPNIDEDPAVTNPGAPSFEEYPTDTFNSYAPPAPMNGVRASDTGVMHIYADAPSQQGTFYRLKVR